MTKLMLLLLTGSLSLCGMVTRANASILLSITAPIALATSEEGNEKVWGFYKESNANGLAEMIGSGAAMLLPVGTEIELNPDSEAHDGCQVIHIKGSAENLYINSEELMSSTNYEEIKGK